MIAPARRAAFRALLAVVRGQCNSAAAVAEFRHVLSDPRDVALASELLSGALRWQAAIDAALEPFIARGLARLDEEVLATLRLGAYQRLFLNRVPASAAVNDAVSLVREAGLTSASGLVNAVLRRLRPEQAGLSWPARPPTEALSFLAPFVTHDHDHARVETNRQHARDAALAYLTTTLSHPRWLVERWLDRFGFEATERWLHFNNTPAPLTLQPVSWRITRDQLQTRLAANEVETAPARFAPDALIVTAGHPLRSALAQEYVFLAQDEASQLVAQLVVDLSPASVLDLCASPGGKTTYIRGRTAPGLRVVACDLRAPRVSLLQSTLARVGARNVFVVRADATRPAPFGVGFDLVLLDVPCSGLGTLRREPEIKWRRTAGDFPALAALQYQMLEQAATNVLARGRLMYATCSSEPEENEHVVGRFLECHPEFRRLERGQHPWAATHLVELLDQNADLRTLPHLHGLEAFYAAVLCRSD